MRRTEKSRGRSQFCFCTVLHRLDICQHECQLFQKDIKYLSATGSIYIKELNYCVCYNLEGFGITLIKIPSSMNDLYQRKIGVKSRDWILTAC